MNAGSLIFVLLIAGGVITMFSMHRRGAHAHGGNPAHGGMGGGCGGHKHSNRGDGEHTAGAAHESHDEEPLLGPPGTKGGASAPSRTQDDRHRGC